MKRKTLSKWVKTEKRIVHLMYRAGILDHQFVNERTRDRNGTYRKSTPSDEFYWAHYHQLHKINWNKKHRGLPPNMPQVHFCTTDYFGESDESPVTVFIDFGLCKCEIVNEDTGEWLPPCKHHKRSSKSRYRLIDELKKLPVKRNDHAINKVLNRREPE